ncbi:elongation factor Tu [Mycobacterium crocinum]|uniref:EF-Tu/IF-2/RF-3 family GTPase n=1 Tax=Mycolicibacterium crocinum TaxID=388459 RepID=A0ABY3TQZ8_9MYCO|nr:EF-Tu/IF-2/RF-3 family GTPase [Mycolicibacterium crocinum]APE15424.1 elongation factor Tu [Mycobacterium sp. WY10]MCV7218711.1 elongation factor Tu [Mycolicibacterium crocinum]ULN43882.1 EF-Tu/IF-2/RF-3 family GTPase [Mycolicibacterium crocinum]
MFRLTVQDVFVIKNRGLVATGRVELGQIAVGDEVRINGNRAVHVDAIESFRKKLDEAAEGANVGLLFSGLGRSDLSPGDVLTAGAVEPTSGGVDVSL